MKKKITTIEELEKEQEKLKMMMQVTKQEFARNLGTNRKQLSGYLFKRVGIPVGGLGLGIAFANNFFFKNKKKENSTSQATTNGFLATLIPVGVQLFQKFMENQNEPAKNNTPTQKTKIPNKENALV